MKVFLSYASEDVQAAQLVQLALAAEGHDVFWDRTSLPAGEDYHSRIRTAINACDRYVFLISPAAIDAGSYTLSELKLAQRRWASPRGRILPVLLTDMDVGSLPGYVRGVTLMTPAGNVAAEVAAELAGADTAGDLQSRLLSAGSIIAGGVALAYVIARTLAGIGSIAGDAALSGPGFTFAAAVAATLFLLMGWLSGGEHWKRNTLGAGVLSIVILGTAALGLSGSGLDSGTGIPSPVMGPQEVVLEISVPGIEALFGQFPPVLSMVQVLPVDLQPMNVARQDRYFKLPPTLLDVGQSLLARVRPATITSHQVEGEPDDPALICFSRGERALESVRLECPLSGGDCRPAVDAQLVQGSVKFCFEDNAPAVFRFPSIIPVVRAQEPSLHWEVPSLETLKSLPDSARPGHTEFRLVGTPNPLFSEADSFTFALRVNGTPVLIDGWTPDLRVMPLAGNGEFALEFGLENLDFSGLNGGYEIIELDLNFLSGGESIRRVALSRDYIALRSADPVDVESDGVAFTWTGTYRAPLEENKFEIFVSGGAETPEEAVRGKRAIDNANLTYRDRRVVGVIRPPLNENPRYGVVLGLQASNGQVDFTVDAADSVALCRWAMETATVLRAIRLDSYRYEMEPRAAGTPSVVRCEGLANEQ